MRTTRSFFSVGLALSIVAAAAPGRAAQSLGAAAGPVPPYAGTGLAVRWNQQLNPAAFMTLDGALGLVDQPGFVDLAGVGPLVFTNGLKAIGDFQSQQVLMPFSPGSSPAGNGQYIVARMVGAWAARSAGTYTVAAGFDDGARVIIGGLTVVSFAAPTSFQRQAGSVIAAAPGLYPIVIEYYNTIQEGAVEVSIAPGEVTLASAQQALPAAFQLVPQSDLYPLSAIGDAGSGTDGGAPDAAVVGVLPDAGADGGIAGAPADAGAEADANTPADAGAFFDAAGADAGHVGPDDASAVVADASGGPPAYGPDPADDDGGTPPEPTADGDADTSSESSVSGATVDGAGDYRGTGCELTAAGGTGSSAGLLAGGGLVLLALRRRRRG
jgi:hypothetical protein